MGGRGTAGSPLDATFERDTIGEYFSITNVGFDPVTAAERASWGRLKCIYR